MDQHEDLPTTAHTSQNTQAEHRGQIIYFYDMWKVDHLPSM